jgi:hypothetical protein
MRSRYTVRRPERAPFDTSTNVDWHPVFQTQACCDTLVGALGFCQREKDLRLFAWVILDTLPALRSVGAEGNGLSGCLSALPKRRANFGNDLKTLYSSPPIRL